jgi:tellurite resistance protein TerC
LLVPDFLPLAAASSAGSADLDITAAVWLGFGALVAVLLVVDLLLFARGHETPPMRSAVIWSIGWIVVALVFGGAFWAWQGAEAGSEYLAGYLLERSLSLDNIFVFAVILSYFAVPPAAQGKVLSWGIALALVLRLVFILLGAALLDAFHATFYVFGALLLYTAYKLARHDDEEVHPEHNPALKLIRRRVPMTDDYDGEHLMTRVDGKRIATPLVAVFVVVATTDIVFAVDSIPAIFAVTQVPFIVFAANAFAMLGLRPLYFVLAGMMDRFAYLGYGLSVILAFIGVKMLLIDVWHPPIWVSLSVIVGVLAITILLSIRRAPGGGVELPQPAAAPAAHNGGPARASDTAAVPGSPDGEQAERPAVR